jgi:hypothetical protein
MGEKRGNKRFRLEGLDVKGKMMFASKIEIIDISIGGISLRADRRLNIGRGYVLQLEDKKKVISVKGVVAWSLLSGSIGRQGGESIPEYTAGMEFRDVSTEKIVDLLDFIERHKKEEVSESTFVDYLGAKVKGGSQKAVNESVLVEQTSKIAQDLRERIEYLHKWHKTLGYYKILDIKEYATDKQINHAYGKMAREFHPDRYRDIPHDLKEKMNVIFTYLNDAYVTLMDSRKRKEYDRMPTSRIRH